MKKFLVIVLLVIAIASVSAVVVMINLVHKIDYKVIELNDEETLIMVRPIIVSNDGKTVGYTYTDEELKIWSDYTQSSTGYDIIETCWCFDR